MRYMNVGDRVKIVRNQLVGRTQLKGKTGVILELASPYWDVELDEPIRGFTGPFLFWEDELERIEESTAPIEPESGP